MSETQMKVFMAGTAEDADEKARAWWNEQIGFVQTLSPAAEQSDNGWVVTIYFREQSPK